MRKFKQYQDQQTRVSRDKSAFGVLTMITAMTVIPFVDGIAKYLSTDYSPLFISRARYAVASCMVLPLAWFQLRQQMFSRRDLVMQSLRTVFLVAAMTLYLLAISKVQLTLALSAYFIGPLITLLLSILFLGEKITVQKSVALALGFVGTLVILRPESGLNSGVVLAFGAGFFFALYLIATRMAADKCDPLQALGSLSAIGHALTIVAFRFAEASRLAPMVYVEILVTTFVGYLVFSEVPDGYTILGGGLIVVGGYVSLGIRPVVRGSS